MKSNMWKSTFREIKQSFGRFMAIFAIIALGVSLFAGLKATRPAMVKKVNQYLTDNQFYDYRILSTLGFEEQEVEFLSFKEDVRAAEGIVSFDIMVNMNGGNDKVLKVYNLPEKINGVELVSGRMPEKAAECVVDSLYFTEDSIGKTLKLSANNSGEDLEKFSAQEFTITGIVQSSSYIQYERGNTSLGNGQINGFAYFPWESFNVDYFTEILVKFDEDFTLYSDEYESYIGKKEAEWENYAEEAADHRYDRIMSDARRELSDAEQELSDAKQEFAEGKTEGESELSDAKKKLEDAKKELDDGSVKLAQAKRELADGKSTLESSRSQLLSSENELAVNERKLKDAQSELTEKQKLLADQKAATDAGKKELAKGQQQLAEQEKQLEESAAGLAQGKEQTKNMEAGLALIEEQLSYSLTPDQEVMLEEALAEIEAGIGQLYALLCPEQPFPEVPSEGELTLAEKTALLRERLTTVEEIIKLQEKALADGREKLTEAKTQIAAQSEVLADAEAQIQSAEVQISGAQKQLDSGFAQLKEGKRKLSDGWRAFSEGEAELGKGEAEIAKQEKKLADGKKEYQKGVREYQEGKEKFEKEIEEAETKISDAESELADAEKEILDIKEPESYLLDRDKNIGYVCFENDSTIVDGIANVFPVFFFAVAALVCITTMSRMIEEQRTQIGVLKALGYSPASIMGKYLFYSGTAALAGCLTGFFAGSWIFPNVIWKAYGIMYDVGGTVSMLDWKMGIISLIVSLGCSIGTTYFTCHKELSEVAAELMRPKAPKAGKRVLLEKVPFIWTRMKFLHKVSYRNVFRYKRRFLMMVFGICGCTGLMLTGFGVRDSVTTLADDQYGQIQVFDMSVTLSEKASEEIIENTAKTAGIKREQILPLMEKSCEIVSGDSVKAVNLVAVDETKDISPYVQLTDLKGNPLSYPKNGECAVCHKLAELFNLKVGDMITLEDEEHHKMTLKVGSIFENYIMNYVYMTKQTYQEASGQEGIEKTLYLNLPEGKDGHQISADLMKFDEVAAVTLTEDTKTRFAGMMDSMDLIVGIIIICAAGLAFIVLYNLTNINITERVREIATIKVLGFYKNETASYIFRENLILTLIGSAAGLLLGNLFHRFVMMQIRLDQIEFDIQILPVSYLYSVLLTFAFAFFINLVMSRKLERISMTESLKSVD